MLKRSSMNIVATSIYCVQGFKKKRVKRCFTLNIDWSTECKRVVDFCMRCNQKPLDNEFQMYVLIVNLLEVWCKVK